MQATLTSKGRMTLPSAVRTRLGLKAGDHLLVTIQDDDAIILKRPPSAGGAALRGLLSRPKRALTVEEMDAGVAVRLSVKHRPGGKS
ncbi:MAG: AbrB/MazE/SpoVT family DNA-binding domain-containing protein [Acidovorax sp.]|nr:AbrB/MazE/SpoVT family DNA-binding domain-containing protein [Acidovorax sp.]